MHSPTLSKGTWEPHWCYQLAARLPHILTDLSDWSRSEKRIMPSSPVTCQQIPRKCCDWSISYKRGRPKKDPVRWCSLRIKQQEFFRCKLSGCGGAVNDCKSRYFNNVLLNVCKLFLSLHHLFSFTGFWTTTRSFPRSEKVKAFHTEVLICNVMKEAGSCLWLLEATCGSSKSVVQFWLQS